MDAFFEIFRYQFLLKAMLAALFTSISCGIIGTYIVSKRIVFLSGGITHASFGGIGIGYFLGINPILGAAVFAVLTALGIELVTKRADVREDSVIGMWWSFGMALGIIFIFMYYTKFNDLDILIFPRQMLMGKLLPLVLSWCILPNLLVFFILSWINYLKAAKGVLIATAILTIMLFGMKIIFH